MATVSEERPPQTAAEMIRALLPGKVRIGVGIYDPTRGRTYRHVPDLRTYLEGVTRHELTRLWHAIERVIKEGGWRDTPTPPKR